MSTLQRTSLFLAVLVVAACSPEQSKNIGNIPKKTIDKAATDAAKAMKQGAERLEKKE